MILCLLTKGNTMNGNKWTDGRTSAELAADLDRLAATDPAARYAIDLLLADALFRLQWGCSFYPGQDRPADLAAMLASDIAQDGVTECGRADCESYRTDACRSCRFSPKAHGLARFKAGCRASVLAWRVRQQTAG